MRSKGLDQTAGRAQAQGRPGCTKCGNEAYGGRNVCPGTGRRCLKCGRLNHFARMCNKQGKQRRQGQASQLRRAGTRTEYVLCVSGRGVTRGGVSLSVEGRKFAEPKGDS